MTEMPLAARDRRATAASALRALLGALLALAAAVAFAAAASVLTGCASDAGEESAAVEAAAQDDGAAAAVPEVLVVASTLSHDPYEQETSTSQNGFTIDLVKLLGEKAGVAVEFGSAVNHKDEKQNITEGEPADVAAKVAAGEADLGASTLKVDEPLEGVAFTEAYLAADLVLVTKMDTGHDEVASLEGDGVRIAVSGDDAAAWVAENFPAAEVVMCANDIDALIEVNSELSQGAVVDEPVHRRYIKVKEPHLQALETVPVTRTYGFAVASGNTALLEALNAALAEARSDGSYDELYEKWFGDAPEAGTATRAKPESVQDSTGA
ncbi:ABC transporter substrate-binding protein [uncultured Adlercreutzia sp.]|uniref:substrate-binding periplasmic protein n=1 Tax=uncultured Adlercreutzia sp. TaxID=875803 RepID=UPI0025FDBF9A|nr:transporter substrate-binding domain-containing protein [uncultured Adlercreutzia sp.]